MQYRIAKRKKVLLFKNLKNKTVQCLTCQRRCRIPPDKVGFCLTRLNINGVLYALNYGLLNGPPQADQIEKKPLYHFLPGTKTLSLGSFGCNYRCKQCLNWWCSWGEPATSILEKLARNKIPRQALNISPEKIVALCLQAKLPSLSFTYNEPTVWLEYALDIAKLAQKKGLKTIFVTNGSWSEKALAKIGPYLDAANIDFKGFSRKTYARMGAYWGQLLTTTKRARKIYHLHLELTTVLIPGINDSPTEIKKMARWIVTNLGPKTPWHLSRYSPDLSSNQEFQRLPAPTKDQLLQAEAIGKKEGLKFIYIWAPGINGSHEVFAKGDTYCPQCKTMVLKRHLWQPEIIALDQEGHCQKCGEDLNFKQ